MVKKILFGIIFLVLVFSLLGCAKDDLSIRQVSHREEITEKSPEEFLSAEAQAGKLVAVYDQEMSIRRGGKAENWLMISNSRDKDEAFTIFPCTGCEFDAEKIDVAAGEHAIIRFNAAGEGQKDIKVKDSNENAYGHATISVMIK
ncbi:hypothetical protein KY349_05590 [Candidatus Woesearchaeota archaeon]|jgi:hypothetical protein|nr:hypothetical protein [Candidatus Woesearchaeota archaeon]